MEEAEGAVAPGMAALLSATYHSMIERVEGDLSDAGHQRLSGRQLFILISIPQRGCSIDCLSRSTGISKHLLENLVQGAVSADYMHRHGDQLELTGEGRSALAIVREAEQSVEREWRENLGEADYGDLRQLLTGLFKTIS